MHDLVPSVNFIKREKHPCRIVTFSKVAGFQPATLLNVTFFHGCFSIMQTVPNRATHHIFSYIFYNMKIKFLYNFVMIVFTLAIKILVQCHWCHSSAFIVNLKHVQHIKLVFLFTTLKRYLLAGHSVHWGINPPPSKTPPPFSCQAPTLNWQTVQAPAPF